MNERSPLLDPVPLAESAEARTVKGGKLVGAGAGDLPRGYLIGGESETVDPAAPSGDMNTTVPEPGFGGFLGRTHGWDR